MPPALCLTFKSLTNHLPYCLPLNTAVNPCDDIQVMKGPAFKRIFLKSQDFFLQCMQVVVELCLTDIKVVFEKLEQDHLHLIEVTHLAEETSYAVDEMFE